MKSRFLLRNTAVSLALCALLGGCASTKPPSGDSLAPKLTPLPQSVLKNGNSFDAETLYAITVAELALSRGDYQLGLDNYLSQARATEDVKIVARATQIARILNRHDEALEMASLWRALDPGSREARITLLSESIDAADFLGAFSEAEELIRAGISAPAEEIAIEAVKFNSASLNTLATRFHNLRKEFPDNIELLVGESVLLESSGQLEAALALVSAKHLPQDETRVIYQRYRLLTALERSDEATATYGQLVELQPDNVRARSHYARLLIAVDRQAALQQYQLLLKDSPNNSDVKLNIALLLQDLGQEDEAEKLYLELLQAGEHVDLAHYWLGEIAENKNQPQDALAHYRAITEGKRFVDAVAKSADIIYKTESLDAAMLYLASKREAAVNEDRERLYSIEASTLSRSQQFAKAEATYNLALQEFSSSISLLYGRAMLRVSEERFDEAEVDFRKVLAIDPDNSATLNALGYTLADRSLRLDEARTLIQRAHSLRSDDPAILDSMGWVEYRLGNHQQALFYLKQAFDLANDHEIAAHYGEVLWREGKTRQAKEIWQKGLANNADSSLIQATMQRLGALD